ncbi:LysM peptidoglycan-binding domain-containing protein [Microbacterium esteraromaticum]|uniref:LysM peptidoglycan-binding domain-containing protein n=1 Tax=Microbacterium esteraromaticum TaxID=57043 RepID=A0A7D7WBV3_9MICO|nr:LysM peptidoglycan-binding domain-containing protein [Microbacterium esteraromaticum]QMU98476.1 LysM peptidoglycan-binding domain-containing protein [Microbacterium esteraromaticum]
MSISTPRTVPVRLAAPAAVIGTLAAALSVAPAEAGEIRSQGTADTAPHMRALTAVHDAGRGVVHASAARPSAYTIKPGDTVSSIARKHGVSTADLLAWNGLGWRTVIYPGQTLRLSPAAAQAAPAAVPAASTAPGAAATHTVVRGDTVYAIAKKYRTTVSAIMSLNSLGGSAIIRPGQTLRVAGAPAAAPALQPVAATTPAAAPTAHTVAAGDTLFGIAKKYGTTVAALLQANGLGAGSIIYPGQSLRLAPPAPAQRSASLDATQQAHAVRIIRIGRELGVPDRGIAIALATAMVESSMRNLNHGDRDSLGLFQQRPSQGWGTPEQITDADRSIRVFYGGAGDPNGAATRGLLDIPGWQGMRFTDAAQTVQVSAFPDRYGQWEHQANRWLATLR